MLVFWYFKRNFGKDKVIELFGVVGCFDLSFVFYRYYYVFCDGELEVLC